MASTLLEENSRSMRSRGNSESEGSNNIIDFSKPVAISKPGCYYLSNAESGCSITLFNDVFPTQHCDLLVAEIESHATLKQYSATHKGSQVLLPRLSAWYGPVDYAYSGVVMKGNTVSDCPRLVAAYKNIAENLLKPNDIDQTADCFLINQYRTGRDSCGEHSDNEPEVSRSSPIITLSLGQQRTMLIREMVNPGNAISVKLTPGSVLVMNGKNFQCQYTHQIPKDNVCTLPRTSVTYRTCDPDFLNTRNALSTSLNELQIVPSLSQKEETTVRPRRPSTSRANMKLDNCSPGGSPVASPLRSPSVNSFKTTKLDSNELLPLSIEAMCEGIDSLKEKSLKSELQRLGCSAIGNQTDLKKRLKKAVKDCHKRLTNHLLPQGTESEPAVVTNAIKTLEKSIIDLQAKISTQNTVLQTLALCSETKPKNVVNDSASTAKELNAVDKRLEKIEELIGNIRHDQNDSATLITNCQESITLIKADASETKERLKTMQLESKVPRQPRTQQSRQPPKNRGNPSTGATREKKSRKVLLLHDSQLNDFKPESFSSGFVVQKQKVGSYNDLSTKHMRDVLSKPQIDCYILQLGVNDYRYSNNSVGLKKAVDDAKSCIDKLLASSSAKIVVALQTPTPGAISEMTTDFVKELTEFITSKRRLSDYHRRLFSVNNLGNFSRALSAASSTEGSPSPLKSDQLHVSEYGLKKLCMNIKLGLYRAFGMKPPRKQAAPEP